MKGHLKALVYRYNSIYEPDVIAVFRELGLSVVEETAEIERKDLPASEVVRLVAEHLLSAIEQKDPFLFVFSINYFPAISEICEKIGTLYVCWSVDCPVRELFDRSIQNEHNRIFLFDRTQYERFAPYNPGHIFYLPLGAGWERQDEVLSTITGEDRTRFASEISFVGSLYDEKNPLRDISLSPYRTGFVEGLMNAQLPVYGCNFLESAMPQEIAEQIVCGQEPAPETLIEPITRYLAAQSYVGFALANKERVQTLNELAKQFEVSLYTGSNVSPLVGVTCRGRVKTITEMPKVFALSKINLNMTIRPIETGLPLRIFDVLGCGGFLITNYQAELPELFEIGTDLEAYSSMEELVDKCRYYLGHDEERKMIAKSGNRKVKQFHSCRQRVILMITNIMESL